MFLKYKKISGVEIYMKRNQELTVLYDKKQNHDLWKRDLISFCESQMQNIPRNERRDSKKFYETLIDHLSYSNAYTSTDVYKTAITIIQDADLKERGLCLH